MGLWEAFVKSYVLSTLNYIFLHKTTDAKTIPGSLKLYSHLTLLTNHWTRGSSVQGSPTRVCPTRPTAISPTASSLKSAAEIAILMLYSPAPVVAWVEPKFYIKRRCAPSDKSTQIKG